VKLTGATVVVVPGTEERGFKITPAQLEGALTSQTRGIIMNSPSNPTGAVYTAEELHALAEVLVGRDIIVLSDDIYEKIRYDGGVFANMATVNSAMKEKTVVINGVSKAYAMTGWRIGYAAGPAEVIAAVTKLQSQNTSNPTSIAQKAALAALSGTQEAVEEMVAEFARRREVICAGLNDVPGFTCHKPEGAFYVFPMWRGFSDVPLGDGSSRIPRPWPITCLMRWE